MKRRHTYALVAILALALVVRVGFVLTLDHSAPYTALSGDNRFYLSHGYTLVTGQLSPRMYVALSTLGVAPVYLLFNGLWQALLPSNAIISNATLADGLPAAYGVLYAAPSPAAVLAIRLTQALLGTLTCTFGFRLAWRLTRRPLAGLVAAGMLALSPSFVLETGTIGTETLYIFLLAAAMVVYVDAVDRRGGRWLLPIGAAAVLFGIATLTRAVLLLFPVGLALHLLLVYPPKAALKRAAWLLLVYSLVVSTWTLYNWARYQRFVVAGEGFAAFIYIGAAGWDGAQGTDAQLAEDADADVDALDEGDRQQVYTDAASSTISSDPVGYLRRRVGELAGAYLQPHGTTYYSGESIRDLVGGWLSGDRSLAGLLALTRADAFWPKLAIYIFHYAGLLAGPVGMWLYRRRWRVALPMIGFIIYTTLVHLLLLALPRYIFPTALFFWVFAAAALTHGFTSATSET